VTFTGVSPVVRSSDLDRSAFDPQDVTIEVGG